MTDVSLARCRLLGSVALRLPMEQIVRDEVIFIHRRRRIFIFGFLQRHEEHVKFAILNVQDAFAMARPMVETPVAQGNQDFVTRVGCVDRQWIIGRRST